MWISNRRFLAGPFVLSCSLVLLSMPRSSDAHLTLENITITVPNGTTDHGDPHLLCIPAKWSDLALFFFGNYLAHAATVKSQPGEPALSVLVAMVTALLYPTSGVIRGLNAILQSAIFCKSPLKAACRAGALCMVVRGPDWKPRNGDMVRGLKILQDNRVSSSVGLESSIPSAAGDHGTQSSMDQRSTLLRPEVRGSDDLTTLNIRPSVGRLSYTRSRKIHGKCILPPGYNLRILPSGATVSGIDIRQTADEQMPESSVISESLSCSYSFSRALVAIVQTIFASVTLYRTKGDQLQHYGYAAFGLTVVPYLIMSIVNLISTIVTPDYPTVYLVRSDIMDEASTSQRKGCFEGIVGSIESSYSSKSFFSSEPEPFDATFEESSEGRMFLRKSRSSGEPGHDSIDEEETLEVHIGTGERHSQDTKLIVPSSPETEGSNIARSTLDDNLILGSVLIGCVAIAIIGRLSRFKAEKSTRAQRVWTMTWLAFGITWGICLEGLVSKLLAQGHFFNRIIYCAPAIGGFFVVGQMLQNYGTCIRIY